MISIMGWSATPHTYWYTECTYQSESLQKIKYIWSTFMTFCILKISTFSFYCEVYGMAKVEGFAALPTLQHVEDWLCPEGNGHDA